jgi:hypothetical protein
VRISETPVADTLGLIRCLTVSIRPSMTYRGSTCTLRQLHDICTASDVSALLAVFLVIPCTYSDISDIEELHEGKHMRILCTGERREVVDRASEKGLPCIRCRKANIF